MKVLFVITGLGVGGAEHVVINLSDELAKLGHEVKIAYLTEPAVVLPSNPNVKLISIGMNSYKDCLAAYFKLRVITKFFKPDVIHSHMVHANIITRLLRLTIKIPKIISTAHSTHEGGILRMLAYRLTDKLADISTNVSNQAVEEFITKGAVKPGRIICVANGIDTDKFTFNIQARNKIRLELAVDDKKIILAVGRLEVEKDYSSLLNAIKIIIKNRQDFKVVIVGDGSLRDSLKELAKKLDIEYFIDFLGIRSDVRDLMSASDIFVLSSAWEGFGLVVAEAMACERFIIATDSGGVREVVGTNGVLIEPKNHVVLANELNNALNLSAEEHAKIGYAARKHIINNYSLNTQVNKFIYLYQS